MALENTPPYATSLIQSARFNKEKVVEAHLTLMAGSERVKNVNLAEKETGRTALMFASFYGSLDAVELLTASDAIPQLLDSRNRSCLHYAALNDDTKLIETIFLMSKSDPKKMQKTDNFVELPSDESFSEA